MLADFTVFLNTALNDTNILFCTHPLRSIWWLDTQKSSCRSKFGNYSYVLFRFLFSKMQLSIYSTRQDYPWIQFQKFYLNWTYSLNSHKSNIYCIWMGTCNLKFRSLSLPFQFVLFESISFILVFFINLIWISTAQASSHTYISTVSHIPHFTFYTLRHLATDVIYHMIRAKCASSK